MFSIAARASGQIVRELGDLIVLTGDQKLKG